MQPLRILPVDATFAIWQVELTKSAARNQPNVFSELSRYGRDKVLKPTIASINPAKSLHNFGNTVEEIPADFLDTTEQIAKKFFAVDGLTSRELLPWPHDPFRQPAPWQKYDYLSVQDRLDQLEIPPKDKAIFEAYIGLFGCCSLKETSFIEILRWYALSGHSIAGVYELSSTYKLGDGGMTAFARCIMSDFTGDRLFGTHVAEIKQDGTGAQIVTSSGQQIKASVVVCTVPL